MHELSSRETQLCLHLGLFGWNQRRLSIFHVKSSMKYGGFEQTEILEPHFIAVLEQSVVNNTPYYLIGYLEHTSVLHCLKLFKKEKLLCVVSLK